MKKGFVMVLTCAVLGSLLLCGCGKKLEKVSAEELIDNAKISSSSLDMDYSINLDADITMFGSAATLAMDMSGNMKSDSDCIYMKANTTMKANDETQSAETQVYYVIDGEDCMEYSSEDGKTWYAMSGSPVDINSVTSNIKSDMLKDLKVENKSKEYVVTGKIDMVKAMESAGDAIKIDESEMELYKNIVIDVTMKFNAEQELKYLAISVDGSTIPENDSLTVRKCDVSFDVNKTSGVSVECPKDVIDNAEVYEY